MCGGYAATLACILFFSSLLVRTPFSASGGLVLMRREFSALGEKDRSYRRTPRQKCHTSNYKTASLYHALLGCRRDRPRSTARRPRVRRRDDGLLETCLLASCKLASFAFPLWVTTACGILFVCLFLDGFPSRIFSVRARNRE